MCLKERNDVAVNKESLLESIDKMIGLVETCKTTTSPANMLCALNGLDEQLNTLKELVSDDADITTPTFDDDEMCFLNSIAKISYIMNEYAGHVNYDSERDYGVFKKLGIADKVDFY